MTPAAGSCDVGEVGRRRFLIGTGALIATPFALAVESRADTPRVGFLISETLSRSASRIKPLRAGLRELGYVEGKNIVIELRPADGDYERLPRLAAELVRLKVDVIVAFGGKAVEAARQATTTIPIVVPSSGDPVAAGLTSSLARPTGNITGLAQFSRELGGKGAELLKESIPAIKRIGWLVNPVNPNTKRGLQEMREADSALKLERQPYEVRSPSDFAGAFQAMARAELVINLKTAKALGVTIPRTLRARADHVIE